MKIEKIILGSQSPRRRAYIEYLGYPVETISPDVEETFPKDIPLQKVPEFLAELKANSLLFELNSGEVLITCDTIVILDNEILGKPEDENHAIELLKRLSGRTHKVVSGVFIKTLKKSLSFSVSTLVTFTSLSDEEIIKYVNEFKPLDKAGAYGIQDKIGIVGVEKIEGSYMNVIGLPVAQIRERLNSL
jgi:septum formation protein